MTDQQFSLHRDGDYWQIDFENGEQERIGSTIMMLSRLEKLIGMKPAAIAVHIGLDQGELQT